MDQRQRSRGLRVALSVFAVVVALSAAFFCWRTAPAYALTSYFIQSGGLIADYDYSWPSAPDNALHTSAPGRREADASTF
jgi:hypothetical protein